MDFTIKGISKDLFRRLELEAAANNRSLNDEIIHCLELAAGPPGFDPATWLTEVDAFRKRLNLLSLSE